MDSDLWDTRLAAAKRQLNMQNTHHISHTHTSSQFDKLNMEDFEGDGEVRPEYPCPYCYEEFEIASSLCSHLEADHLFESKFTVCVCPICSVNVNGDLLSHITVQHGYLFKIMQRPSPLRRLPFPSNHALSSLPGRKLRETYSRVVVGGNIGYRSNNAASLSSSTSTSENFLSSLVSSFSGSETEDVSKSLMSTLEEKSAKNMTTQYYWKSSCSFHSLSCEEREQRMKQEAGRAIFVQDLFVSTLLAD